MWLTNCPLNVFLSLKNIFLVITVNYGYFSGFLVLHFYKNMFRLHQCGRYNRGTDTYVSLLVWIQNIQGTHYHIWFQSMLGYPSYFILACLQLFTYYLLVSSFQLSWAWPICIRVRVHFSLNISFTDHIFKNF